uniref:EamA domain-containing protein n=1 Tax=Chromera velia CCMP2878 TaxID=1169474 RepID=A0A0G4ICH3_9ALVE|eukprot:Cvel_13028.t1-p1 / transcript=Cvel_13028.t1 / gene=Cvel_13028 / organism=Chromera_velia_CCMP2878 / gene_product=hypothetical protein / transcript_product=hypothetical protein / location=Cvel_scaffold874:57622-58977(+) / protein_length=452 / sequence_SO=supercontig / SO=protein_coding / is_pseudo=false
MSEEGKRTGGSLPLLSQALRVFFISLAPFFVAGGLPLQAVCNIGVGRLLGHPLWGVSVSCSLGAVVSVFLICHNKDRTLKEGFKELSVRVRSGPFEWVALCPAVLGAFWIGAGIFVPPLTGFGPFYTAVVCGQISMSMLVDCTGIIWSPRKRVSIPQAIGAVLVVCGVLVFQLEGILSESMSMVPLIGLLAVALGAGCSLVVESTLTRRLSSSLGTPWRAVWFDFFFAAILATVAAVIVYPSPSAEGVGPLEFWKFVGGIFGVFVVAVGVIVPSYIGFVFTFSMQVLGQLVSSVLVDLFVAPFLLGVKPVPFTPLRAGGLSVVVVGVLCGMFADALVSFVSTGEGRRQKRLKSMAGDGGTGSDEDLKGRRCHSHGPSRVWRDSRTMSGEEVQSDRVPADGLGSSDHGQIPFRIDLGVSEKRENVVEGDGCLVQTEGDDVGGVWEPDEGTVRT